MWPMVRQVDGKTHQGCDDIALELGHHADLLCLQHKTTLDMSSATPDMSAVPLTTCRSRIKFISDCVSHISELISGSCHSIWFDFLYLHKENRINLSFISAIDSEWDPKYDTNVYRNDSIWGKRHDYNEWKIVWHLKSKIMDWLLAKI